MSSSTLQSSNGPVPWDPVLPGTGAQRARALIRLYVRFTCGGNQLATLVIDALILTFQSEGASVTQLESYLGIKEKRIRHALESLPRDLRCTSLDLSEQLGELSLPSTSAAAASNRGTVKGSSDAQSSSQVRHFVNYRTAVPFVYAHMTRMFLTLSALPVPPSFLRNDSPHSYLSPTLRRSASTTFSGILCRACNGWFDPRDFHKTLSLCPQCGADVVMDALQRAKERFERVTSVGNGRAVILYETVVAARKRSRSGTAASPSGTSSSSSAAPPPPFNSPTNATPSEQMGLTAGGKEGEEEEQPVEAKKTAVGADSSDSLVPPVQRSSLGVDPFLVQQGLYFRFLCSSVFVCVADELFVVDADAMMTREEYIYRSKHKATIMDQFRLLHPNTNQIRVHIPSQSAVEAEKVRENELKMAKRLSLPPWLKPTQLWDPSSERGQQQQQKQDDDLSHLFKPASTDAIEASANGKGDLGNANKGVRKGGGGSTTATTAATATPAKQRQTKSKLSDVMMDLAVNIAAEYYDDDFDEVDLSHLHAALKEEHTSI